MEKAQIYRGKYLLKHCSTVLNEINDELPSIIESGSINVMINMKRMTTKQLSVLRNYMEGLGYQFDAKLHNQAGTDLYDIAIRL